MFKIIALLCAFSVRKRISIKFSFTRQMGNILVHVIQAGRLNLDLEYVASLVVLQIVP